MSEPKLITQPIPLERTFPPELQTHFVTNMVVQHRPEYFILSFFEVWPPPVIGDTEDEILQQLSEIPSVEAKCVARLVVPPENMQEFIEVLQTNFNNWEMMKRALDETEKTNDS